MQPIKRKNANCDEQVRKCYDDERKLLSGVEQEEIDNIHNAQTINIKVTNHKKQVHKYKSTCDYKHESISDIIKNKIRGNAIINEVKINDISLYDMYEHTLFKNTDYTFIMPSCNIRHTFQIALRVIFDDFLIYNYDSIRVSVFDTVLDVKKTLSELLAKDIHMIQLYDNNILLNDEDPIYKINMIESDAPCSSLQISVHHISEEIPDSEKTSEFLPDEAMHRPRRPEIPNDQYGYCTNRGLVDTDSKILDTPQTYVKNVTNEELIKVKKIEIDSLCQDVFDIVLQYYDLKEYYENKLQDIVKLKINNFKLYSWKYKNTLFISPIINLKYIEPIICGSIDICEKRSERHTFNKIVF